MKNYNSEDLFMYALVQLKHGCLATAQAFWVFAFESLQKEKYKKHTGWEAPRDFLKENSFLKLFRRDNVKWYYDNKIVLGELTGVRNDIVHESFLNESDFLQEIMRLESLLFNDRKNYKKRIDLIDAETESRLAFKLQDRIQLKKEDVEDKKYSIINKDDFSNPSLLEKKIHRLRYEIDDIRFRKYPEFENLYTGPVSKMHVSSGWIWIPIGFNIKDDNERVEKAIISVLILRNGTARVYLDFGTEAQEQRLRYYGFLKEKNFKKQLLELCRKCPEIKFFNVKSYSQFVDKTKIMRSWLKGGLFYPKEIEVLIEKEKQKTEKNKKLHSNILLFGKEFPQEYFSRSVNQFASDIFEIVKLLLPFLKMFE